MAGTFSPSNLPQRAGSYFRWITQEQPSLPAAVGSVVAIPFTHDWGPFETPVLVNSYQEFMEIYGDTVLTPGHLAVRQAFQGEGVSGARGAGAVLCYRMGGSTATKASRILQNTSPAPAITLSARYEGSRGNTLRFSVQDYAVEPAKSELIVKLGTVEVERYRYLDTDITDLALQINQKSDWVTAGAVTSGTALAVVADVAATAGDDGSTLVAGDWTSAMAALEVERFGYLAPFNLTDTAIQTSFKTWTITLNSKGKRFFLVIGGLTDETGTTADLRSVSMNDENILNVGVGSLFDDEYLDVNGNPTVLSSSQLAPRIAGIMAQRGEAAGATFAILSGTRMKVGPTEQEIDRAYDNGTIVLGRNMSNQVRIERSLTTYSTITNAAKPRSFYSRPRNVRIQHGFEMEMTEWQEGTIIGRFTVHDDTLDALIAEASTRLRNREERRIIRPGWTVRADPVLVPDETDDFMALEYGIVTGKSVERVFNSVRVR